MEMGPIRYADNDGVSIAYTTIGEGPTDLIFVSGFVSHLEILPELPQAQRFFERLSSFCRIICFDKRGMGLSDRDAGAYTLEAVSEDMIAVLDAAGLPRPRSSESRRAARLRPCSPLPTPSAPPL